MATDSKTRQTYSASNLIEFIANDENSPEDRIDAAVSLVRIDHKSAEEVILRLLEPSPCESFDFQSELLDVVLGEWVRLDKSEQAEALLNELHGELKHYGEAALKNLADLRQGREKRS